MLCFCALQGAAIFTSASASDDLPAAKGVALGPGPDIESRDAAPQHSGASGTEPLAAALPAHKVSLPEDMRASTGASLPAAETSGIIGIEGAGEEPPALTGRQHGAAGVLKNAGSGLSAFWDKHWSHTDITGAVSRAQQRPDGMQHGLNGPSVSASLSDAGHLSTVSQPQLVEGEVACVKVHITLSEVPSAEASAGQADQARAHVRLEVLHASSAACASLSDAVQAQAAQTKGPGFAPVARLASLGGYIRSQPWKGAGSSSELASRMENADFSSRTAENPTSDTGRSSRDLSIAQQPVSNRSDADASRVRVDIQALGADSLGGAGKSCSVAFIVARPEEHSSAAGKHGKNVSGSLHSLSGLFRASKPFHSPQASPASALKQGPHAKNGASSNTEHHGAGSSVLPAAEQEEAGVARVAAEHQRARWASLGAGAVSSLYGMVHHAAEAPLAHAGRAVGSLPGLRVHTRRSADHTDIAAEADKAAELVMRIKTAASAVLEVRLHCQNSLQHSYHCQQ